MTFPNNPFLHQPSVISKVLLEEGGPWITLEQWMQTGGKVFAIKLTNGLIIDSVAGLRQEREEAKEPLATSGSRPIIILESPYAPRNGRRLEQNLLYLRRCLLDSWRRGELPFASHAYFPFFLRESNPEERAAGIAAGFALWPILRPMLIAFYIDHGMSPGMEEARKLAEQLNLPIDLRNIKEP